MSDVYKFLQKYLHSCLPQIPPSLPVAQSLKEVSNLSCLLLIEFSLCTKVLEPRLDWNSLKGYCCISNTVVFAKVLLNLKPQKHNSRNLIFMIG